MEMPPRPARVTGVVRWDARRPEDEKRSCALSSSWRPAPSLSCGATAAILDAPHPASSWPCGVHRAPLWGDAPSLSVPCAPPISRAWRVAYQPERVPRPGAWLPRRVPVAQHASYRRRHVPSTRMSSACCSFHPYRASSAEPARWRPPEQRQARSPRRSHALRGTWTFGPPRRSHSSG